MGTATSRASTCSRGLPAVPNTLAVLRCRYTVWCATSDRNNINYSGGIGVRIKNRDEVPKNSSGILSDSSVFSIFRDNLHKVYTRANQHNRGKCPSARTFQKHQCGRFGRSHPSKSPEPNQRKNLQQIPPRGRCHPR